MADPQVTGLTVKVEAKGQIRFQVRFAHRSTQQYLYCTGVVQGTMYYTSIAYHWRLERSLQLSTTKRNQTSALEYRYNYNSVLSMFLSLMFLYYELYECLDHGVQSFQIRPWASALIVNYRCFEKMTCNLGA